MTDSYLIGDQGEDIGDEIHLHGNSDGKTAGGTIAFSKDAVKRTAVGIEVPVTAAPRLVTPPQGEGAGAKAAQQVTARQRAAEAGGNGGTMTGWYCICIGQACYTYQCSDNTYLGQCFPVPCQYYDCKTG